MGWSKAKSEYLLETAGINPKRRAETLTLEEWSTIVEQSQNIFSA
jgi:predicted ribosome quality control (RQC) complex YloA/Tae2 family protein